MGNGAGIGRAEIRATIAAELGCPAADVGDHDDLIALGLNSICMMALAGGWRRRGADVTFAELAASPTVDSWHRLLRGSQPKMSAPPTDSTFDVVDAAGETAGEEDPFPLAPMQHAYWIGRSEEQELGGVAAHLYVEFDGSAVDPMQLARS